MGKADFLSPKAISNRIKSKGLQKLRWYCQMCQKQCRDENGFKCHCMSESHQRQLLLASEDPNKFMDYFSDEFRSDFLELLSRRFGTKRVHNNIVYNEYISDREHVHMNSTQWETLTDFTKWLGREGYAKVDETPKGWYIQYIDRDPETIRRQEEQARKKKQELDDEERSARFIEEQVRRGRDGKEAEETPVYTELKRESEEEKVAFNLGACSAVAGPSKPSSSALGASALKAASSSVKRKDTSSDSRGEKKKKSALEEIIEMEEKKKKKQSVRTDYWLQPNIVVKVVTKKLGEKYHKKKAVVTEVRDKYGAVVKMIDSGDKLKLDQNHLETVIPAPGKQVLILNGPYRDMEAVLEGIDEKQFSATLTVDSGQHKGKRVDVAYEDFSKLA
ncbi:DNA/RNA-binding protein KIN17 isoform X1 [Stegastes partitus]|uniref:DNA/RNA-binding protein KIN17 n=1 Tax=Stegastes partitus TaxID=144197 RepID=A0A3B4ZWW1_9TELE|nr:PREDICTED: DNA/RNA-binding protein KIN17-like isoform X1 [Stegastes partitus]XP_008303499.1 PREDICTED: DNA/RNA-binding protein KIN17-like isoform X1 [Stegastes partitus]